LKTKYSITDFFLENKITEKLTKFYFWGEGVATFMPIDYNFKGSLEYGH
jgi:hypothetical protein